MWGFWGWPGSQRAAPFSILPRLGPDPGSEGDSTGASSPAVPGCRAGGSHQLQEGSLRSGTAPARPARGPFVVRRLRRLIQPLGGSAQRKAGTGADSARARRPTR